MEENNNTPEIKTNVEAIEVIDAAIEQMDENEEQMASEIHPDDIELEPAFPSDEDLVYPDEDYKLELDYLDNEKQEDKLWQARTGLDFDSLCGAIETVIFMSDKPVALTKIKNLIDEDMPLRVIHDSISRLQEEYESKHHGLRLVEVAEGYQFRTKATYSKYVQDLFKVNSLVLSPTALEVLAIVAYKQPIAKTEVDKIRGVDSGHIVRGLMDKRLVKVCGRSDEMGRPVLYGTTPEFLEVFNLARVEELPPERELEEMIDNGVGKISDIKSIVQAGDKEAFVFDEIDELDELTESIKLIASETDFTKSLKGNEKKTTVTEGEEGEKRMSAFDLLEEYVNRDLIVRANSSAIESEMMSGVADPQIVSDLEAGPYNTPDMIEEEEEDFQMIDLDTGLPIVDDSESEADEEIEIEFEADEQLDEEIQALSDEQVESDTDEATEIEASELLIGDSEEEAQKLSEALDDAFARLTGEKLDDDADEEALASELNLSNEKIETEEKDLEDLTEQIVQNAKDLDLDLGFMQENNTDTDS